MSIDPKALEAAQKIIALDEMMGGPTRCAILDAALVARALLAGEGPDNGRGSMAAGGKSHVIDTEPCKSTPGARAPSPAVPKVDKLWIGVNSLGVPDLATLHVDERDCRALIDEIVQEEGDVILVPRRCSLTIDGVPSPSPAVRSGDERDAFEAWAEKDNRRLEGEEFEERAPDNNLYYQDDTTNHAYVGWYARALSLSRGPDDHEDDVDERGQAEPRQGWAEAIEAAAKVAEEKASYCLTQRVGHTAGTDGYARWTSLWAQAASTADSIRALQPAAEPDAPKEEQ